MLLNLTIRSSESRLSVADPARHHSFRKAKMLAFRNEFFNDAGGRVLFKGGSSEKFEGGVTDRGKVEVVTCLSYVDVKRQGKQCGGAMRRENLEKCPKTCEETRKTSFSPVF